MLYPSRCRRRLADSGTRSGAGGRRIAPGRRRSAVFGWLAACLGAAGLLLAAPAAHAQATYEYIVFNPLDDVDFAPDGSLRQGIDRLNVLGLPPPDDEDADPVNFLRFDLPTRAPILLEGVLADIEKDVEIVADPLFGGLVAKTDDEEIYDILRVSKGTTMIDGVIFRDGPITVGIDAAEGADARLGFRYAEGVIVEFDEDITGLGGVIKEGAGDLILSGVNSFDSGLLVREGRVVGDEESIHGDVEVEADALLLFAKLDAGIDDEPEDEAELYLGTVTGEGAVQKQGLHDLSLAGGGLLHTGGTEIFEGSITATPATFTGDVVIANDANLVMDFAAGIETWAGSASGDGAIAKNGAGTLELTGTHTNAGGIFVGEGTILGAAANLPPRIELATGGSSELEVNQATDDTYAGEITGDGMVRKDGAGTLTLTGSNSWVGDTTIVDGRLRGSLAAIPSSSIIVFTPTSSLEYVVDGTGTYDGVVSGSGAFVKSGSGRLGLTQVHPFTGGAAVESGTLELTSGSALSGAGTVTVASGATLTGEGSVAGPIDVQGTLRPGDGLGTQLDAGGDVTLAAGSTFDVILQQDIGGALPVESRLVAGGQTTLDGGTIDVTVEPGSYAGAGQIFPVILSGSIVENVPLTVVPLYAFVDVTAQVNGANLEVGVVENGANAAAYAQTQNQLETALALDDLLANGTPETIPVRRSLVSVTAEELPPLLDDLSAQSLSVLFTQRIEHGHRFSRAIARRFTAGRYEDSPPKPRQRAPKPMRAEKPVDRLHGPGAQTMPPAPTPPPTPAPAEATPEAADEPTPPPAEETSPVDAGPAERVDPRRGSYRDPVSAEGGVGIWGDVFGVFGRVDGGEEADDVKNRLFGFTLGLDYRLPEGRLLPEGHGLRFGGAVDYGRAVPFGDNGKTESEANLVLVGGHTSWTWDVIYAGVVGRYGYMDAESSRRIVFGDIDDTAVGEFDGHEGGIYTEAGARIGFGERMLVQPRAGFEWTRLSQSDFVETGAPALDLDVDSASIDSLRAFIGANLAAQMTLQGRFGIEPELRVGYSYEFGDVDRIIDARLTGATLGGELTSIGAQPSRHEILIGAGYTMRVSRGMALALDYDARVGDKQSSHAIAASLYLQW